MKQEQPVSEGGSVRSQPAESTGIEDLVEQHGHQRGGLIAILEAIQAEHGYLPESLLRAVSAQTGRSLVDIYAVATFYRFFSLQPKGKHVICACLGTACHVRGARQIVAALEQQLGIKAGQTTADRQFTLETVNCLGACALGPVVVIDGRYFSKVRQSQIPALLEQARAGFDRSGSHEDDRAFPVEVVCPHCHRRLRDETHILDEHPAISMNVTFEGRTGWVRLSRLYGRHNHSTELEIPDGTVVGFRCPLCDALIPSPWDCLECGAPMISVPVEGGGQLNICTRRGCTSRRLDWVSSL